MTKQETDESGYQEANGNFERATWFYRKDWSLYACDNKIPSTLQVWSGQWGAKKEAITQKAHLESCLRYAKNHSEDSEAMWRKVLWSDETKMERFGLNAKRYV